MKLKIKVRSWNNYLPPPHTHTSGGGLLDLPCTKDNYLWVRNCSVGPLTKYQKFLLSPKINLFGLHKIAWRAWLRHSKFYGMIGYANHFMIIFLNIYLNVRNERKMVIKLRGCTCKITHIVAADISRLPHLVQT